MAERVGSMPESHEKESWTFETVDPGAASIARNAADAAGKTLSEWLDQAVLEHIDEVGPIIARQMQEQGGAAADDNGGEPVAEAEPSPDGEPGAAAPAEPDETEEIGLFERPPAAEPAQGMEVIEPGEPAPEPELAEPDRTMRLPFEAGAPAAGDGPRSVSMVAVDPLSGQELTYAWLPRDDDFDLASPQATAAVEVDRDPEVAPEDGMVVDAAEEHLAAAMVGREAQAGPTAADADAGANGAEPAGDSAARVYDLSDYRLDPEDMAALRAIVAGEASRPPRQRSRLLWPAAAVLVVAAVAGGAALTYSDGIEEARARLALLFQDDSEAGRAKDTAAGGATGETLGETESAAKTDGQVERLPLEESEPAAGAPEDRSAAPAGPPPEPASQHVEWYRKAAARGDHQAQKVLGDLYATGKGLARNDIEAAKLYHSAAAAGLADAQYALGAMYEAGRGVKKDPVEAVIWFELAAKQNHGEAQLKVAQAFSMGYGIPQNLETARIWYQRAARQGLALAKYELGIIYRDGLGTPRNNAVAFKWLSLAGADGHAPAVRALESLMPNLNADELAEAKELLREADSGNRLGGTIAALKQSEEARVAAPEASGSAKPKDGEDSGAPAEAGAAAPETPAKPAKSAPEPWKEQRASADKAATSGPAEEEAKAPAAKPEPAETQTAAAPSELVAQIQKALLRLNLDAGNTDGRLEERTVTAIRNYQQTAGLPVDGAPSEDLLWHLRAVLRTVGAEGSG